MSTCVAAVSTQLCLSLRGFATLLILKARRPLTVDKIDEFVELFSEHVKFPTSIVYWEKMNESKVDQVRRLQGSLSISAVVVDSALKETAERQHSSWKLVDGDAEAFAVVVWKRVRTMLRHHAQALQRRPTPQWAQEIRDAIKNPPCSVDA